MQGDVFVKGGSLVNSYPITIYSQSMTDYIGKKKDEYGLLPASYMTTNIIRRKFHRINDENGVAIFKGYVPVVARTYTPNHWNFSSKRRSNSFYALELLSRTNPMRPEYSVPVSIKEMLEVVSMFKLAASTLAGIAGSAYLNYRFGWVQFVNDIRTLASITKSVERRVRELNSLIQHGGLRRNITLDTFSGTWTYPNKLVESAYGIWSTGTEFSTTVHKVTGSVRWVPAYNTAIPELPIHQFNLAVQQVLDLEGIDPATLWDLVPFSWLLDYFSNLHTLLEAYEGRGMVKPIHLCITDKVHTRAGVRNTTEGGSFVVNRWTDTRNVISSVSIETTPISLLSVSQWKVIAALLSNFKR